MCVCVCVCVCVLEELGSSLSSLSACPLYPTYWSVINERGKRPIQSFIYIHSLNLKECARDSPADFRNSEIIFQQWICFLFFPIYSFLTEWNQHLQPPCIEGCRRLRQETRILGRVEEHQGDRCQTLTFRSRENDSPSCWLLVCRKVTQLSLDVFFW